MSSSKDKPQSNAPSTKKQDDQAHPSKPTGIGRILSKVLPKKKDKKKASPNIYPLF